MALDFSALKKNRGNFDDLMQEVEKINTPSSEGRQKDERFWQPEVDKSGNGYAVIRFLPPPKGEELPWARVWHHAFQSPSTGKWYIENSLTTLNKPDPVSELNTELWHTGEEKDKETARRQKRKLSYYTNIYVVSDPKRPENEGRVFLYKFGKKIFDKVMEAMQPEFEDETPINPFDFWQGANFKLKLKKVAGYWNYDSSEFDRPSPLLDDDDALEALWQKQYSLSSLVATDQFKSYEDLEKRLKMVLGAKPAPRRYDEETDNEDSSRGNFAPDWAAKSTPAPDITPTKSVDSDEDDALSYFQKLAEE